MTAPEHTTSPHRTAPRPSRPPQPPRPSRPFTLWREVLTSYAAPALTAGAAGVLTGQRDLAVAACTSIAGTSAVVAFLVGTWLRHGGRPRRWTLTTPRGVLAAVLVVIAAVAAALLGWFAAQWLPAHTPVPATPWLERLRVDLPVSAALAATIVTLRWRGSTTAPSA
ncbi:hypothetical protein Snoj_23120 [Streptomyces nojiriensis]|uniref:Integral membrane protein n=1 Tax=Streptomyces nojiriensis TaxID=66374 RepID=A0ABQ3SJR7_9ACTN|nr:hypothetical protein [Streptomyces nojiriensis]QTI49997.1 hypothetical protein JYK04_07871 [Streptomyces nojiriensis]GGS22054.1 hypothetical protein GCM10010205_59890 [Streptomyces nojiriensis]GHI68394.1 hypothetical protein Snoj_23120 [Streptomyces nojiriensis]